MDAAPASAELPDLEPPMAFGSRIRLDRADLLAAPLKGPAPRALELPLSALKGVGPKLADKAADELGLRTLRDLLLHVPRRHMDRAAAVPLSALRIGESATVLVEVREVKLRRTRRKGLTILEVAVADAGGAAKAIWFNRPWLADQLSRGDLLLLHGRLDKRGFTVDEHERAGVGAVPADVPGKTEAESPAGSNSPLGPRPGLPGAKPPPGLHTTGMVAVHPGSESIRPPRLRDWVWQAAGLARALPEPLPAQSRVRAGRPSAADSVVGAHLPGSEAASDLAREAIAFEELLLHQASLALRRERRTIGQRAPSLPSDQELERRWRDALPFEPTDGQVRAIDEIDADLAGRVPMQRLLMGEVGSGKTVVALHAMLLAVAAGKQAALMAPTETLADQHHRTIGSLLGGGEVSVHLLTGSTSAVDRERCLGELEGGVPCLVVGTHALIEPSVRFSSLAVAVVDEQHRFGVRQRAALEGRGEDGLSPHVLHMTATPIPRTLSLTAYGDLDASVIRELPAGRAPVATSLIPGARRGDAYRAVRERVAEGRQAYIVCPLVSESEKAQARAAEQEFERLESGELADLSLGLLHGRLDATAKASVMERFAAGDIDVLVATTVVEVGVDVPNAAVMIVEGAERFGISQLHQLRGRVGRGSHESQCLLVSEASSSAALDRLEAVAGENDGFRLAEIDLEIRGEGEILGVRQHGMPAFRVASLPSDAALLSEAREELGRLLAEHGSVRSPALECLLDAARLRFGDERAGRVAA